LSGTNLNVGIYDNDLKGVGQDARSNWTTVQSHERAKLCVPLLVEFWRFWVCHSR